MAKFKSYKATSLFLGFAATHLSCNEHPVYKAAFVRCTVPPGQKDFDIIQVVLGHKGMAAQVLNNRTTREGGGGAVSCTLLIFESDIL